MDEEAEKAVEIGMAADIGEKYSESEAMSQIPGHMSADTSSYGCQT
jgi:hypothetical protein